MKHLSLPMRRSTRALFLGIFAALCPAAEVRGQAGPSQATGFKVGEVTDAAAIVWTRLTLREKRNPSDGPEVTIEYNDDDRDGGRRDRIVKAIRLGDGATVGDLRQAVPGVDGEARVQFKSDAEQAWRSTDWQSVDPLGDFTRQFALEGLQPATRYQLRVESRGVDGSGRRCARRRVSHAAQER